MLKCVKIGRARLGRRHGGVRSGASSGATQPCGAWDPGARGARQAAAAQAAGGLAGPGGGRWRAGRLAVLGGSVERWWQQRGLGQRLALGRAGTRASGRAGGAAPECGGPSGGRSRARQQTAQCRRGEQPRARGPRQSGSRSGGSGCNSLAERHGPRKRAWRG
jgi:hypothetical protein